MVYSPAAYLLVATAFGLAAAIATHIGTPVAPDMAVLYGVLVFVVTAVAQASVHIRRVV